MIMSVCYCLSFKFRILPREIVVQQNVKANRNRNLNTNYQKSKKFILKKLKIKILPGLAGGESSFYIVVLAIFKGTILLNNFKTTTSRL